MPNRTLVFHIGYTSMRATKQDDELIRFSKKTQLSYLIKH